MLDDISIRRHSISKRRVVRYFKSEGSEVSFVRGKGCYVYDELAGEHLDCVLGYGPVVLGHSDDEFNNAISEAIKSGIHFPGFSSVHDEYLSRLLATSGLTIGVEVAFMKTSSESNTASIRIASQITGRKGVIRCGFTGWHDVQYASSPSWHMPPGYREPVRNSDGMRGVNGCEAVFNWSSLELNELADLLKVKGHSIACIIIDAFQFSFSTDELFVQAIQLCRTYGIIIVLDETKTAGRVGPIGYAGERHELWDMLVVGKAIGNGAPLSLLLLKDKYRDAANRAQVGGTHSKEILSVQCALATQRLMQGRNGYKLLQIAGHTIANIFTECTKELELESIASITTVMGGSILDIRFNDTLYHQPKLGRSLQSLLLDNGILYLVGHPSFVSLAHLEIDKVQLKNKFLQSLGKWKEKDLKSLQI